MEMAEELEAFIQRGRLWDAEEVETLIARLDAEADAHDDDRSRQLGRFMTAVRLRLQLGPVPTRLRYDIEGIVYPRLWKVMEAVWDGLPDAELRTRLEVMNRRLSRLFADEIGTSTAVASSDAIIPDATP